MTTKTKTELERELTQLKAAYENFQTQVRDRIISAIDSGEICREGGIEALDDFGLEREKIEFSGSFNVTINFCGFESTKDQYREIENFDALCDLVCETVTDAVNKIEFNGVQISSVYFDDTNIYES